MNEFTIERLDHRARGLASGVDPVPRVLPGEVVDAEGRILTPSGDRIKAPCRHYKTCGGCALQHASDAFVGSWKQTLIQRGLEAQGIEADIRPILTSPPNSRRRATLHARRTKKGVTLGFLSAASELLVDTPECQLLVPEILEGRPAFEALTLATCSRKGQIDLAVTASTAGLDVAVSGGASLNDALLVELAALAERYGLARLCYDHETIVTRHAPAQAFGSARVVPPPRAFLQATQAGQNALTAAVAEALCGAKQIVDLFAGCGTFTLPTAAKAEVLAVEASAPMLEALDAGWRQAQGLRLVSTEVRDLFRRPLLPDELRGFDAIVIDPPRAGATAQIAEIAAAKVPRIAAVSCNPVSFARDSRTLIEAGYSLDWVQPVDQFRWSAHTELVAQFSA